MAPKPRANIIGGLLGRGYLLKKGRAIRASDAAFTLIRHRAGAIADPGTTAVWEQALDMIEAGQMTLDTFIAGQSAWAAQPCSSTAAQRSPSAAAVAILSAVPARRCASAPARTALFWSQPLPGLQGERKPVDSSTASAGAAQAAGFPQGVLTPTNSIATPAVSERRGPTSRTRGIPQHTPPSATVCVSLPRERVPRREGRFSANRVCAAIPLIDMLPSMVRVS